MVSGAEKKAKDKKKKLEEKKRKEEQERREREEALANAAKEGSLTGNGIVDVNDIIGTDDGGVFKPKNELDDEDGVSGIDASLNIFKFGNEPGAGKPNMKALHKAFEAKILPTMKEEHPGLKLRQYQQRIFDLWVKSPENSNNMMQKK